MPWGQSPNNLLGSTIDRHDCMKRGRGVNGFSRESSLNCEYTASAFYLVYAFGVQSVGRTV